MGGARGVGPGARVTCGDGRLEKASKRSSSRLMERAIADESSRRPGIIRPQRSVISFFIAVVEVSLFERRPSSWATSRWVWVAVVLVASSTCCLRATIDCQWSSIWACRASSKPRRFLRWPWCLTTLTESAVVSSDSCAGFPDKVVMAAVTERWSVSTRLWNAFMLLFILLMSATSSFVVLANSCRMPAKRDDIVSPMVRSMAEILPLMDASM